MSDHRNSTAVPGASTSCAPKTIDGESWRAVCDMETPIWTIHDILTTIGLIAPSLNDEHDDAIAALQRLVTLARNEWKKAEELRGQLFRLNHPNRDNFNVVGWPGDEVRNGGEA